MNKTLQGKVVATYVRAHHDNTTRKVGNKLLHRLDTSDQYCNVSRNAGHAIELQVKQKLLWNQNLSYLQQNTAKTVITGISKWV